MDFTDLRALLDGFAKQQIPGCGCVVYHKHREVFRHSSGYADLEAKTPVTDDTLYFIFSATKVITCTAALQLFEKGLFLLDDPVSDYLPEYKDMLVETHLPNGARQLVPAKNPITIRQLFSMTSGITYDLQSAPLLELRQKNGGRMPTREVVRAIAEMPLAFEPGTHWYYGLSHDVLGGLIEALSGMSFGEYLQKNIFEPCGMKRTRFGVTDENRAHIAPLYDYIPEQNCSVRRRNQENPYYLGMDSGYESGGAGLISCPDDYILFADAMSNHGKTQTGEWILSPASVDLMRTNALDAQAKADYWQWERGYGYGLGVRTLEAPGRGGTMGNYGEFGWDGAAGAFVLIDPDEELALYYTQSVGGCNSILHPRIRHVLYAAVSKG